MSRDDPAIGLCATGAHDADLWFSDDARDIARAAGICQGCPIQQPCLEGAKARLELAGVWGGQKFGRRSSPLRTWAADNGITLPRNGRVPDWVQDAYYAAIDPNQRTAQPA